MFSITTDGMIILGKFFPMWLGQCIVVYIAVLITLLVFQIISQIIIKIIYKTTWSKIDKKIIEQNCRKRSDE